MPTDKPNVIGILESIYKMSEGRIPTRRRRSIVPSLIGWTITIALLAWCVYAGARP